MLLCDDGNLINDDGCNKNCFPEADYVCAGNTFGGPDICRPEPPEFLSLNATSKDNLIVEFTTDVEIQDGMEESELKLQLIS
jgi:hypothetical protein